MKKELPDELYEKVIDLTERGNIHSENLNYQKAHECFCDAWDLLPEPKEHWLAAGWISIALGDNGFLAGKMRLAEEQFGWVIQLPEYWGNPFVQLRYGQVLFEKGEVDEAKIWLNRAYDQEGAELFELDDPKYLELVDKQ